MHIRSYFLLVVSALVLAGCMSTQEIRDRRINENLGLFNQFPPEIQTQVRKGQIDIGFTSDMVRLAWGEPDTVFNRTTKKRIATVWRYTRTRIYPYTERMSIPVYFYDSQGRRRVRYHSVWVNWDTREEYTVARVEFVKGRVSAIEQLER